MNAKELALKLFDDHIDMAYTDPKGFRKLIMDTLREKIGCSIPASATHYNNAKKSRAPIEGLGRLPSGKGKGNKTVQLEQEQLLECFSTIELVGESVGRTYSYSTVAEAEKEANSRLNRHGGVWLVIKGMGPNPGEKFKLESGEEILCQNPVSNSG